MISVRTTGLIAVAITSLACMREATAQWLEPDAQALLSTKGGQLFGWAVRGAGDVNGDGVPDFCASAPFFGGNKGAVYMRSGLDGSTLWAKFSNTTSDVLGQALETIGDLDGDGVKEVVAGAPFSSTGRVVVYSGSTGTLLQTLSGVSLGDGFGGAIATGGDFDGDGIEDFAVGAIGVDAVANNRGRVYVYSGNGFGLITTIDPLFFDHQFGTGLAFIGDVTGDLRDDLAVGVRQQDLSVEGRIRVYRYDGSNPIQHFFIDDVNMNLSLEADRVDGGKDINQDGVPDIYSGDIVLGIANVYSGIDGSVIHSIVGPGFDGLGTGGMVDDQNGDGYPDLLVGAKDDSTGALWSAGRVYLFSGKDGSTLRTITNTSPGDGFGSDVAILGDLDGDGVDELVVGAWGSSEVYVMAGTPCFPGVETYGPGHPGTQGIPALAPTASPAIGTDLALTIGNSLGADTSAVLFLGPTKANAPTAWGGALQVSPAIVIPIGVPAAGLAIPLSIPLATSLCGAQVFLQVMELDPGATQGISESQGLGLEIGV